jgi:RNA polymerase sigma-70 factor, ECF subfamily
LVVDVRPDEAALALPAASALQPSTTAAERRATARRSRAQEPDAELTADLDRARCGDEAAFTRVFRAVQPGLLRYLSTMVGADAEDTASEAWAQVCRDLGKFRGDIDGFRGWVVTIARHRAIDQLRARGRRPADPVPVEELHERPAADRTDGSALESLATVAALRAIKSLPPDQAEAVLLRTVMGLDAKTAGQVLGKRAGAVRAAAFRGLQNLADRIDIDRDGDDAPPGVPDRHNTAEPSDADEMR